MECKSPSGSGAAACIEGLHQGGALVRLGNGQVVPRGLLGAPGWPPALCVCRDPATCWVPGRVPDGSFVRPLRFLKAAP